jgi:hypothetical protein
MKNEVLCEKSVYIQGFMGLLIIFLFELFGYL